MGNDHWHFIYQNSNQLKTHQDNLRWTISAGYFSFVGVAFTLLKKDAIPPIIAPYLPGFLFVFGTCFLLILSVESWYYNIFSAYVTDCENRFAQNKPLLLLQEFRKDIAASTTPFHHSFIFVLGLVGLTNIIFLHLWLSPLLITIVYWSIIVGYVFLLILACKFWNLISYKIVLRSIQRLLG